jgi:hypothetical protein
MFLNPLAKRWLKNIFGLFFTFTLNTKGILINYRCCQRKFMCMATLDPSSSSSSLSLDYT